MVLPIVGGKTDHWRNGWHYLVVWISVVRLAAGSHHGDKFMTDTWGVVIAIDGDQATVRVEDNGCGRCRESAGCGGGSAGEGGCRRPRTFRVPNPEGFPVGVRVRVAVVDGAVGRGAVHAYGVPLLAVLGGAIGGSAMAGEAGAICGALIGLLVGWLGLRRAHWRSRGDSRFQPSIRR